VNEGVELQLISGPKDFDALAGLGLKQQLLTKDVADTASDKKTDNAAKPAAQTAAQAGPQVVGLGINGGIDLLNKQNASHAHVVLQGAMALIKQAYSKLNNPTQPSTVPAGSAPGYMQTQLAGYQTALAWLNTLNGG